MTDLLTLLREHDLPPRWDGHAVLWDGWHDPAPGVVFICPTPRQRSVCEGCGSTEEPVCNRGRVAIWASLTHDDLRADDEIRRRLGALAHKWKPRALHRLRAYRCPECRLDTVWDMDTGEWWVLDHTDYGDDGSVSS